MKKKDKQKLTNILKHGTLKEVPVADIKLAPFNPKRYSAVQAEKLKASIEEKGFITPIVVNKRTMTVLDGNQRVKYLQKYQPQFNVPTILIDVDEVEEKEINILLEMTRTSQNSDLVDLVLEELKDTKSEALKMLLKEKQEKLKKPEIVNSEYEIVQEPDESYDYIIFVFDKSLDFLNVKTRLGLKEVYNAKKKKIGLGRVVKGQVLLDLLDNQKENEED